MLFNNQPGLLKAVERLRRPRRKRGQASVEVARIGAIPIAVTEVQPEGLVLAETAEVPVLAVPGIGEGQPSVLALPDRGAVDDRPRCGDGGPSPSRSPGHTNQVNDALDRHEGGPSCPHWEERYRPNHVVTEGSLPHQVADPNQGRKGGPLRPRLAESLLNAGNEVQDVEAAAPLGVEHPIVAAADGLDTVAGG